MDFSQIDLSKYQELARLIVVEAANRKFASRRDFEKFRNAMVKKHKGEIFHNLYFIKAYNDLLREGKILPNENLLKFIQKRGVRTLSGVAPVTVLTKPYPCPGRCIYCPVDSRMPKSYLASQPAAQRGYRQQFDPYTQVFVRLQALRMTGHEVSKVELRILGGTWSAYPKNYQTWFLKRCLQAMNEFFDQLKILCIDSLSDLPINAKKVSHDGGTEIVNTVSLKSLDARKTWKNVVEENETSKVRCIGINIETRPDFVTKDEVKRLRKLGVTKVELGVQTIDDAVQKKNLRGHTAEQTIKATRLLKESGFKIGYHIMPNLYGSNAELDLGMIKELFTDSNFQPDYLKIYPCVVLPKTKLANYFRLKKYKPYSNKELKQVLYKALKLIPEWCRIDRIARDIPANEMVYGFKTSNIRQILEDELIKEGSPCRDIRAREIKGQGFDLKNVELVKREYLASEGREIFISYEDVSNDKLIALIRLRFPSLTFIKELKNAALIREVHVYGRQIAVGRKGAKAKQHFGWGTKLLRQAEKLAKDHGYKKMAVIAGIGTREYYRKKGYKLEGTYMVKYL